MTFAISDSVTPALAELRRGVTSKAKLRAAVRPAARVMKGGISRPPVPRWLVKGGPRIENSSDDRSYKQRGLKRDRNYRGYRLMSGNLRKSSLIVAGLRRTSFLVVGHRWGSITPGSNVGSTKASARGFYGHMLDGGTAMRKTKHGYTFRSGLLAGGTAKVRGGGLNRGRLVGTNHTNAIVNSKATQVLNLIEKGFVNLLDKEKIRTGLA